MADESQDNPGATVTPEAPLRKARQEFPIDSVHHFVGVEEYPPITLIEGETLRVSDKADWRYREDYYILDDGTVQRIGVWRDWHRGYPIEGTPRIAWKVGTGASFDDDPKRGVSVLTYDELPHAEQLEDKD